MYPWLLLSIEARWLDAAFVLLEYCQLVFNDACYYSAERILIFKTIYQWLNQNFIQMFLDWFLLSIFCRLNLYYSIFHQRSSELIAAPKTVSLKMSLCMRWAFYLPGLFKNSFVAKDPTMLENVAMWECLKFALLFRSLIKVMPQ